MALQSFEPFGRLPDEIKLLIWEEATKLVLPQVIQLEQRKRGGYYEDEKDKTRSPIVSASPIHPLFHACRGSRHFLLTGEWCLRFGTTDGEQKPRIPFNTNLDTLYFVDGSQFQNFASRITAQDRHAVKKLMIMSYETEQWESFCQTLCDDFPHLERLIYPESNLHPYCPTGMNMGRYWLDYDVEMWDQDDKVPHLIQLEEIESGLYGTGDPDDYDMDGVNERDWAKEYSYTHLPEECAYIEYEDPVGKLIGLQVDLWGYPLENPLDGRELRQEIQRIHRLTLDEHRLARARERRPNLRAGI